MSHDAVERRRSTCFPDPEADDPTDAVEGESRGSWLGRSTSLWATQFRAFYNRNLAALPLPIAERLCSELHVDRSKAKHFELVVGRFLQVLGATELEYEIEGSEGSRVDWRAHFDDGAISVEATQPLVNAVVGETTRARRAAEAMAIREAPPGWLVWVRHVPAIGPNESLQPLRRLLRDSYRSVPPATPGGMFTIEARLEGERLQITLIGSREPTAPARWGGGGAVAFRDDTSEVVANAIEGKRRQARGAAKPVLVALCTDGWGISEVEQFDSALLGRMGWSESGAFRFDPVGAFRPVPTGKEPTFAGALIFANLAMVGGPDPILYLHPRFRGTLPAAITGLRQRYAKNDAIQEVDGIRAGLLATLGWPEAQ
jgi:hypothetical protein